MAGSCRQKSQVEAWSAILRYCSKSERCIFDVNRKLREWRLQENRCREIIEKLIDESWINENRYADAFVHDKLMINRWGRLKIRAHLYAKKIPTGIIDRSLNDISEHHYLDIIKELFNKRINSGEKDLQRNIRYIMTRGFEYEKILEAIKEE